jgi:two-component system sensor histidine kinase HydH
VADSLKLVERQAQQKQITIDTRNSEDIDLVKIDPDRINQVLLNLYLNAIEAMESGGRLRIAVSGRSENGELTIQVSDTGNGIAADDLTKIFDPYFTTKSSGTGLGLAIAHNIVEALGGAIEVNSKAGVGTTFTLTLPIKEKL